MVGSFVPRTVWPSLNADAVLFIVFPCASVSCTVRMGIRTLTVGLIIFPITFVNVSVSMIQSAFTVSFILTPLTLVFGTVGPFLLAVAVTICAEPFAIVDRFGLKFEGISLLATRHISTSGRCRGWVLVKQFCLIGSIHLARIQILQSVFIISQALNLGSKD